MIRRQVRHRFIPAHAGNTCVFVPRPACGPVYPRSRGEHINPAFNLCACPGLSPLTRGTLCEVNRLASLCRFIPAHAGNTRLLLIATSAMAVYPRSRGEHVLTSGRQERVNGLSPLTRGTQTDVRRGCEPPRFIPAHAGNTAFWLLNAGWLAVYPRSRGEHIFPG